MFRTPSRATRAALPDSDALHFVTIGVRDYADPGVRSVSSAMDAALSWMLQAFRAGAQDDRGQHLIASGASNYPALGERLRRLATLTGLSTAEEASLDQVILQFEQRGANVITAREPTLVRILEGLVLAGNAMWQPGCEHRRLLLTFTGHGTLSGGELCLCLSDVELAGDADGRDLVARRNALKREAAGLAGVPRAIDEAWTLSRPRGMRRETVEVLEVLVRFQITAFGTNPILVPMVHQVIENLRSVPPGALPSITLGNVLTWRHLKLLLGSVDDRLTLILDACHSGGPGDALQGSHASHQWLAPGRLRSRIFSASAQGARAAEARIGDGTLTVATWGLTRVLSRWRPVADGATGRAVPIRNGELAHRANVLLEALSFRQQISFHAPPAAGRVSTSDMAFLALEPDTHTTCEPDADAGGIQIVAGANDVIVLGFKVGTSRVATLLVFADNTDVQASSFSAFKGKEVLLVGSGSLPSGTVQVRMSKLASASSTTVDAFVNTLGYDYDATNGWSSTLTWSGTMSAVGSCQGTTSTDTGSAATSGGSDTRWYTKNGEKLGFAWSSSPGSFAAYTSYDQSSSNGPWSFPLDSGELGDFASWTDLASTGAVAWKLESAFS